MKKILYCDSDREFLATFGKYLACYGLQAVGVEDTDLALEKLQTADWDLLICDLWARPVGGTGFCESLRNSDVLNFRELPIMLVGPEELPKKECQWLRQYQVHYLVKYKSPEVWYPKLLLALESRPSGGT